MTKYICKDNKPLYPQPEDYLLSFNDNGNVVMSDGCICSDITMDNVTLVDIDEQELPNNFEHGKYAYINNNFVEV